MQSAPYDFCPYSPRHFIKSTDNLMSVHNETVKCHNGGMTLEQQLIDYPKNSSINRKIMGLNMFGCVKFNVLYLLKYK